MDFRSSYTELDALPISELGVSSDWQAALLHIDSQRFGFEVSQALEDVAEVLFDWRNVDDATREQMMLAWKDAFREKATEMDLHDAFQAAAAKGPENALGFLNALKGKMAEYEINDRLGEFFPNETGLEFQISASPIQEVFDHFAVTQGNVEILVQTKMKVAAAAGDVIDRMESAPEVFFAVSTELFDKLTSQRPDLVEHLLDSGIENASFTANARENLELLAGNEGLDVPDSLGELLPYLTEVVLTIRLIVDTVKVEKDLARFSRGTKSRMQALRALLLLQRFGVSVLLVGGGGAAGGAAGTAIGSVVPGLGNAAGAAAGSVAGSVAGAVLAGQVNKLVKPHVLEFALQVTGVGRDDLFYFQNKRLIDDLGWRLRETSLP